MQPYVLRDYAINTAKLYPIHVAMAREGASNKVWTLHAKVIVLPLYRREFQERHEGMSDEELAGVGAWLRTHYMNHIAEVDQLSSTAIPESDGETDP